ncbi:hypothetical protein A9Q81_01945 [Gammaproteobacteria bacterium 42_54_T18]|nr:hypothetical protein A9Q81_01945 [Gammaproteobacteria bacterium 42_54_T18]
MFAVSSTTVNAMERYVAGVHYKIVAPEPSKTKTPHVISFFSYACPHCNHLEPAVEKWREKHANNVQFERVPAQWNPLFKDMARFYYALNELHLTDKYSQAVFDEIHKKKRSLHTEGSILAFVQTLGLDKAEFKQILNSDAVKKKMRKGKGVMTQYKIPGVPSFVVNGRYFVNVSMAGSPKKLFEVLDFLLTK